MTRLFQALYIHSFLDQVESRKLLIVCHDSHHNSKRTQDLITIGISFDSKCLRFQEYIVVAEFNSGSRHISLSTAYHNGPTAIARHDQPPYLEPLELC
jgi:hypothetical protein